ncbi:type VII secretion integral membrane protein EccD [Catenuloplanes sp. NPDC051500]|uniref:type VII secretion integral membrane protein EccD n=1 Tax=Catenuloplanes sp. NPDC051500 TaxID=3363959 RepID=UPI0037B75CC9
MVCGPDRQIEVAVPAHVLVADLLPALLHHLGDGLADKGLDHGGWILQRLGAPPLDEELTVTAHGLHDGDVVHLRPRAAQLPEVDFDDLIDGMAAGVRDRAGRWRPEMSRWTIWALTALLLALGPVAAGLPGPAAARALLAFVLAAGALTGAFAIVRAAHEAVFGVLVAIAGVANAVTGGLALLAVDGAALTPGALTGAQVFAGSAAGLSVALVTAGLLRTATPLFTGLAVVLLLALVGGSASAFGGLDGVAAAGVVAIAATMLLPMVPMLAFRLAGMRLTPIPTKPEHLQEEIEPIPAAPLLNRATITDRFMTGLYAGLGAALTVAALLLSTADGWPAGTLLCLLATVWLLSARPMTSAFHRAGLAVPAAAGLAGAAVHALADVSPLIRLAAAGLLAPAVPALLAASRALPERRLMPWWGRAGDIVQTLATVALFPVLLALLGVYGFFRAIGG